MNFEYSSNLKYKSTFESNFLFIYFLAYQVETTRCGEATLFIQNIVEKENINAKMLLFTSKLKPNIFIAFSRGTSITVALVSRTREPHV